MHTLWLEVIRDGRHGRRSFAGEVSDDVQGNLQTLEAMATIVREDVRMPDLRAFVMREIVGHVPGHRYREEIDACFEWARDKIVYRRDPVGVERVSDLWSTIYALNPERPEGDCGIKSLALATCLGLLGQVPFFVVMTEEPDAGSYSHVYVGTVFRGQYLPLDPTPEENVAGKEAPAVQRMIYPIFESTKGELQRLEARG